MQQQQYVRRHLESIVGEGGKPVLVLDGKAYPPKAATRQARRTDREAARRLAEQAEAASDRQAAESAWKIAAAPQEPFWAWLMQECINTGISFLVAPYEADAQLVSLAQELGPSRAVIWAASNDSDLAVFGGHEVVYDWDAVHRTFRSVRLQEQLLGRRVGARSFANGLERSC